MRRLGKYLRRYGRDGAQAVAGLRPSRGGAAGQQDANCPITRGDLDVLTNEIDSVARYVSRLKREIGALRPNEIYRDRLPAAHGDLASIRETMAESVNTIMTAAEGILASQATTVEAYRVEVEERVFEIFEACSFQDLTGQRVSRVDELICQIEKRLQRFALAVKAADSSTGFDRDAILREARKEVLIVEGPQNANAGVDQDAIDKLFD